MNAPFPPCAPGCCSFSNAIDLANAWDILTDLLATRNISPAALADYFRQVNQIQLEVTKKGGPALVAAVCAEPFQPMYDVYPNTRCIALSFVQRWIILSQQVDYRLPKQRIFRTWVPPAEHHDESDDWEMVRPRSAPEPICTFCGKGEYSNRWISPDRPFARSYVACRECYHTLRATEHDPDGSEPFIRLLLSMEEP